MSSGEAAAAARAWAADTVRAIGLTPATVEHVRVGEGLARPVPGLPNPSGKQIFPDRFEIVVRLPGDVAHERVAELDQALRRSARDDDTLGGRVHGSSVQDGREELEREYSQEYGDDSWKLVFPITTYRLGDKPIGD